MGFWQQVVPKKQQKKGKEHLKLKKSISTTRQLVNSFGDGRLCDPCQTINGGMGDFLELRVGLETKEFVRVCLWNKLLVHSRVLVLSGTKVCPLCGAEETVNHALGGCCFYTANTC